MDAQPVQTAEQFAEELHRQWKDDNSERNRGIHGETDDYFYIRLGKLKRSAGTFYLYKDQDGGVENGVRHGEDKETLS